MLNAARIPWHGRLARALISVRTGEAPVPRWQQAFYRRCAIAMMAGLLLAGCRSTSQTKADKGVIIVDAEVTSTEFAGTALSGPLASSVDDAALAGVWHVKGYVNAVQQLPTDGFEPVGPLARLIYGDAGGELIAPSSRLVYSSRIRQLDAQPEASSQPATMPNAGTPSLLLNEIEGAVAPGTTLEILIAQPDGASDEPIRQRVQVEISRKAEDPGYEIAIISQDRVIRAEDIADVEAPGDRQKADAPVVLKTVRETVVIPCEVREGGNEIALAIPMAFRESTAQGIVIVLAIQTAPDGAAALADELKKKIDQRSAEVRDAQQQGTASPADMLTSTTLDALNTAGDAPRAMLVYLADQTGAKLAEAVALVADDRLLAIIAKSVREKVPNLPSRDRRTVGWMLERATIDAVASISEDETDTGLPAVRGVLETYAGEAGRQIDLLKSLADEATSCDDLYNRLIAEHIIYLEDNSPAARVRAYDWLTARGSAPSGYDPLADTRARRDALEAWREAATTQPK